MRNIILVKRESNRQNIPKCSALLHFTFMRDDNISKRFIFKQFTHLRLLWRAISQVKAKGNGSSGKRKRIRVRFVRF